MVRLAFATLFALSFAASPAFAGDAQISPEKAEATVTQPADKAEPAKERRLTRTERWRGKPYLTNRWRGLPESNDEGRLLVNGALFSPGGF